MMKIAGSGSASGSGSTQKCHGSATLLIGCLYVPCDIISEQQSAGLENKIISLQQKLTEAKEENKQLRVQVRYILLLPKRF
jgi:hypothetical protein